MSRRIFSEIEKQPQPPLWRQGLEEVKLAFLYLLLQGMSLFLAVQGHAFLSTLGAALSIAYLVAAMALDKKTVDGTLRFVLPSAIGAVHVRDVTDIDTLVATLEAGRALCEWSGGAEAQPTLGHTPDGADD